MRDHVTRRQIPTDQSIHWKPLRDPHYVVASLQPNDGGRRPIFIKQQLLARIETIVRAQGRRAFGLLIGQPYYCPVTNVNYLVVESIAEQNAVADEGDMSTALARALDDRSPEQRSHIAGWYRGVPTVESRPSASTAGTHTALFNQPWQMTVVVAEGSHALAGAVFLRDTANSRWFSAPFYEVLEKAPARGEPKGTVVDWPQHYITAENIEPASREVREAAEWGASRSRDPYQPPKLEKTVIAEPVVEPPSRPVDVGVPLVLSESEVKPTIAAAEAEEQIVPPEPPLPPSVDAEPLLASPPTPETPLITDRPAPRVIPGGLADVPQPIRDRPLPRRNRSTEKLSIVDDRDQRAIQAAGRRIGDADDTMPNDHPSRYIELARVEGFFIAAKFNAVSTSSPAETLWILNEPYSGILLSVVTTDAEVVDATLHYNMQTDEAGLHRVPFPEHRDVESKTIYLREACLDSLRARCRRLRATNALLREWKVTPAISFLTPGEWESVPTFEAGPVRGADAVSQLNNARIAELPAGVRTQFHLPTATTGEATA